MEEAMRKIMYIFIIFFFISNYVESQTEPYILPKENPYLVGPSPEVASFMRYGQYPVSHNTGVPEIFIPIYTIQSGKLSFPINLSYYAGGIKVDDQASWVGLGWTLNAGGAVNISIQGMPDSPSSKATTEEYVRRYGDYQTLELISIRNTQAIGNKDNARDKYDYYFNGNSGSFFIGEVGTTNNKVMQFPYTDNKIIRNQDESFTIITPDGTSYHFKTQEKAVVFSLNKNESGVISASMPSYLHTTAWMLDKILSFNKTDSIVFLYEQQLTNYMDISLSQKATTRPPRNGAPAYPEYNLSHQITKRNQIVTQILKEIRFNTGKIVFDHNKDRTDSRQHRLTQLRIFNNIATEPIRKIVFENNSYFSGNRLKLSSVSFLGSDNTIGDKYSFNYFESSSGFPSPIKESDISLGYKLYYSQDELGYYNGKSNGSLLSHIPFSDGYNPYLVHKADRSFSFTYAKELTLNKIDYITGGSTEFVYDYYPEGECRSPALRVKEIVTREKSGGNIAEHKMYRYGEALQPKYPFGLNESNPFAIAPTISGAIPDPNNGLSINYVKTQGFSSNYTISNYASLKTYKYSYIEELISGNVPHLTIYEYEKIDPIYEFVRDRITFGLNDGNTKSCVTSTYIKLKATNFLTSAYEEILDMPNTHSRTPTGYVIDTNWKKPELIKKTAHKWADGIFVPAEIINYEYKYYNLNDKLPIGLEVVPLLPLLDGVVYVNTSEQSLPTHAYDNCPSIHNFLFYNNYVSTGWKKLVKKITERHESGNVISSTETFAYGGIEASDNKHSFVTSHIQNMGESGEENQILRYPRDVANSVTKTMIDLNNIAPVISTTTIKGKNTTRAILTDSVYYNIQNNKIIVPTKLTKNITHSLNVSNIGKYQTDILKYDIKGNPVHLVNQGNYSSVYLWSYSGQYPIAEIKNATLTEVTAVLSSVFGVATADALSALTTPNEAKLKDGSLQKALPNALVTTYTYKPLVGILTATDPAGLTTTYEYDTFGRLIRIKDPAGKIIQSYNYHYQNQ